MSSHALKRTMGVLLYDCLTPRKNVNVDVRLFSPSWPLFLLRSSSRTLGSMRCSPCGPSAAWPREAWTGQVRKSDRWERTKTTLVSSVFLEGSVLCTPGACCVDIGSVSCGGPRYLFRGVCLPDFVKQRSADVLRLVHEVGPCNRGKLSKTNISKSQHSCTCFGTSGRHFGMTHHACLITPYEDVRGCIATEEDISTTSTFGCVPRGVSRSETS